MTMTISGLYCNILVVLGMSFPVAEVLSAHVPTSFYETFYFYLYLGSMIFLIFVYMSMMKQTNYMKKLTIKTKANDLDETKPKVPQMTNSRYGSFHLRMGAAAFGIGSMIYAGLEFGQYFELVENINCSNVLMAVTPALRMVFIVFQLQFIFVGDKQKTLKKFMSVSRFGLMHMIATNLCVWLNVLVQETKHEILNFYNPNISSIAGHKDYGTLFNLWAPTFLKLVSNSTPGSENWLNTTWVLPGLRRPQELYECRRANIMGSLVQNAAPFLFPCTIEYSLICAVILYALWKNIGEKTKKAKRNGTSSNRNMLSMGSLMLEEEIPARIPTVHILSDSHGRLLARNIQNIMPEFRVTALVKPGASTVQVTHSMIKTLESMTGEDFLILMCGSNDVYSRRGFEEAKRTLSRVVEQASRAKRNMCICTVPINYSTLWRSQILKPIPSYTSQYFTVDCANAHKGLFASIIVIVFTIISLIMFFALIKVEEYATTAVFQVNLCELTLYVLSTLATIMAMYKIKDLKYETKQHLELDNILLVMAQTGLYMYFMFSLIAGYFTREIFRRPNIFITSIFGIIQSSFQTIFIVDAWWRRCTTSASIREKPARQLVTFLLLSNIAMWAINHLENARADFHPIELRFYGVWAWTIITHLSMPLAVFYRFHSTVCLCEIWKCTYKMRLENFYKENEVIPIF